MTAACCKQVAPQQKGSSVCYCTHANKGAGWGLAALGKGLDMQLMNLSCALCSKAMSPFADSVMLEPQGLGLPLGLEAPKMMPNAINLLS